MRTADGKGNNARKVLSYYRVNFEISAPYQILCDGPTMFQSLKNDIFLKHALPKLLGGTAYPVVTNCVVEELRSLGEDYSSAALFAKRATRVPCAHDGVFTAKECVVARVNTPFDQKLMLATNDVDLLSQVAKTPGVPLIAISNQTKLALKSPSRETMRHVQRRENVKTSAISPQDRALLEMLTAGDQSLQANEKVTRKRKRAKGPNPLSVKKSKTAKSKTPAESRAQSRISKNKGNISVSDSAARAKTLDAAITSEAQLHEDGDVRTDNYCEQGDERPSTIPADKRKRKRRRKKPIVSEDIAKPSTPPENGGTLYAKKTESGQNAVFVASGLDSVEDKGNVAASLDVRRHVPLQVEAKKADAVGTRPSIPEKSPDLLETCGKTGLTSDTSKSSAMEIISGQGATEEIHKAATRNVSKQASEKQKATEHSDVQIAGGDLLGTAEGTGLPAPTVKKKQRKNRRRRPSKI